ncbi:hypothetical protein ACGFNV_42515 [Streptomyces sp. NPDC048751]|uniref:hypothetical protein n=1 Tax=Streptomyces sp. NPDC048751 TaxID=3365591 RepID=UPI003711A293
MNQSTFTGRRTAAVLNTPEDELKFAELIAQAYLDPTTAERYATAPAAVLDEFGLALGDDHAPALPRLAEDGVVREDFTGLGTAGVCLLTLCIADAEAGPAVELVAAAH